MRKLLLVAALVVAPTLALAETDTQPVAPSQQHHLAVAPQVVLPLGDWGDAAGLGLGLTLNYEYALNDQLGITGRVGYIHHLATESQFNSAVDINTTEIPVLAGVKYEFVPNIYGQAELGLWHVGYSFSKGTSPDSVNDFGLALGAGYQLDNLAFGLEFIMPNAFGKSDIEVDGTKIAKEDGLSGLMFNAAYTFMGF
jgi:hypothetical protein